MRLAEKLNLKMAFPAGTAWLFNGRTHHAALHNDSDEIRRVLIYNYGHFWMKVWAGYEPSEALKAKATKRTSSKPCCVISAEAFKSRERRSGDGQPCRSLTPFSAPRSRCIRP